MVLRKDKVTQSVGTFFHGDRDRILLHTLCHNRATDSIYLK